MVYAALGAVGAVAVAVQRGATAIDMVPVAVGFVTWLVTLSLLTEPLRHADLAAMHAERPLPEGERETVELVGGGGPAELSSSDHTRRTFVIRAGVIAAGAVVLAAAGRVVGRGRRHVEETRRLLRLPQVTEPQVPRAARIGLKDISPWQTPNADFYLIHTAIVVPAIEPMDWSLRIHGRVDREITISYSELLERTFTEAWITLNCVSNDVGGPLIGNAWWSGVRVADLLALAGPHEGADAVLQTSEDGWNCGTPLAALTDDRNAMLAVAMNGSPLPIEHGFPVRTVVPGLYGYVSACKWVVDMEVTTFDEVSAYWTERGWGEQGPVKMSSRIDVPRSGAEVPRGPVTFGGVAWAQHTGIDGRGALRRRRRLAARRGGRAAHRRHLGAVEGDRRGRGGRPHGAGAGDRQGGHRPDRRRAGRAARRRHGLAQLGLLGDLTALSQGSAPRPARPRR